MLIAHLSDPHIRPKSRCAYGIVNTAALLRQAVAKLQRMTPGPDVVLITGDLTDCGLPAEYAHLRELLEPLRMPVYLVPGNHDRREHLRAAFPEIDAPASAGGAMHYVVEHHAVRLIGLDTVVAGQGHGEIGAAQLQWLEARLAEGTHRPTALFMHHPPFSTGIVGMDRISCTDGEALGRLVRRHGQVERVLCGHVHRAIQIAWEGTLACVAPSTAHQMVLDLSGLGPERFCMEPPGFMLHVWRPGQPMVTHTSVTGAFAGPFDFELDPEYPAYGAAY